MTRIDARTRLLASGLAALAGFVDAVGFLASGGFFVSFMSGNSTRLAVGLAERLAVAVTAAGLVLAFVTGVVVAALLANACGTRRQRRVLVIVTGALGLAAAGASAASPAVALLPAAFAMGALNILFERDGDVRIGLTYMTGTLVKIGQRLAEAFSGGARWDWLPFLMLWLGLILGAVAGAASFARLGLHALWIAVAVAGSALLFVNEPVDVVAAGDPGRPGPIAPSG